MTENVFKRIIKREIPADIVYESKNILAFRDIAPKAPVHILIIPKKDIESLAGVSKDDLDLLGEIILVAKEVAIKEGIDKSGFRLVANTGQEGGQEVPHLHFHLLGGRQFSWPPG
jgi:histidine triad (HIT) family protein